MSAEGVLSVVVPLVYAPVFGELGGKASAAGAGFLTVEFGVTGVTGEIGVADTALCAAAGVTPFCPGCGDGEIQCFLQQIGWAGFAQKAKNLAKC